ncbi:hypothetical protein CEP54_007649 [Fusarium duplospermum]|uniref:DUF6546 domain-containing protein n=1 Tax=Fusarium duplospermum TaxID=1325734 RepID=A0A428Q0C0_9HYPO|nr:hypothetical protein CEP54_007649 [Fusarium duplospermum]
MADKPRCHRMELRASTRWKTMSFGRLPVEIRFMILEMIVQQRYPGWASFASVCKEWQHFIEKRNFCRLKLSVSCLNDFQRLVVRQRDLVRHILLDIQLPTYTCQKCIGPRWPTNRRPSIGFFISGGIRRLFCILDTWKTTDGLTLELGAHSPSDSKHWFRNYLASDKEDFTAAKTEYSLHDPLHGWSHGQQVNYPPERVIRRLFSSPNLFFPDERVPPEVKAVKCLTIRREMRRSLPPLSLGLILSKLPRLENLIFEPWRMWDPHSRVTNDKHMAQVITKQFPQSLKRVSIFEDFSDHLTTAMVNVNTIPFWPSPVETYRVTGHQLASAFAIQSRDLEHLSVAYMIDADDFFQSANRKSVWENLQSLALTSKLLRPTASRKEIDSLLHKAGTVALRMLRLHTLVIWDGIKGNACAFIFHVNGEGAQITWRSTWEMELSSRVVKAWEGVTSQRHLRALRVDNQEIHELIESHGDAIYHLDLPCQVVSPASLGQIRREGRFGVVASSDG